MAEHCSVPGCLRDRHGRGFCMTHYMRWRNDGDPGPADIRVRKWDSPCSVNGCDAPVKSRGLCGMHAARLRRHGEVGDAAKQHAVSYDGVECSIEDCGNRPKSNGLCSKHDHRARRYGDPTLGKATSTAASRFSAFVVTLPPPEERPGLGPCHGWSGTIAKNGYGLFSPGETGRVLAHRWSYIQANGPIDDSLVIDHLCRNRSCVNPDHMEPVTNLENLRRGAGYGLRNGMRSTCINGHDYTPDNTYLDPRGGVRCRRCARDRDKVRSRTGKRAVSHGE